MAHKVIPEFVVCMVNFLHQKFAHSGLYVYFDATSVDKIVSSLSSLATKPLLLSDKPLAVAFAPLLETVKS